MKADVDQKGVLTGMAAASRPAAASGASIVRSRLFIKYVALFVTVVVLALVANGAFEVWFSYQEQKASLINIQREQASSAADKIEAITATIEVFAILQFQYRGQTMTKPVRVIGIDPEGRAAIGGFSEYLVRQHGATKPNFATTRSLRSWASRAKCSWRST